MMQRERVRSTLRDVQRIIDQHAGAVMTERGGHRQIDILEAGCGSATQFCLPENARLAGIDTSPEQLERNRLVQDKIVGDLETYELPEAAYDMVLCFDVMEHLAHPQRALAHMMRALRPGGILIICAPVRESFKGIVTRWTPHWFHVFVYKYLLRDPHAGEPDRHPFLTYMKPEMGRGAIVEFAARQGLSVEFMSVYGHNPILGRLRATSAALYYLAVWSGALVRYVSFGAIRSDISDFALVLKRGPALT